MLIYLVYFLLLTSLYDIIWYLDLYEWVKNLDTNNSPPPLTFNFAHCKRIIFLIGLIIDIQTFGQLQANEDQGHLTSLYLLHKLVREAHGRKGQSLVAFQVVYAMSSKSPFTKRVLSNIKIMTDGRVLT